MINYIKKISAVVSLLVVISACNHDPEALYHVSDAYIPVDTQQRYDAGKIGNIIAETAVSRGWSVEKGAPGILHGKIERRNITTRIDIKYSKDSYSINAVESGSADNRQANKYIRILKADIDKRLASAAYK